MQSRPPNHLNRQNPTNPWSPRTKSIVIFWLHNCPDAFLHTLIAGLGMKPHFDHFCGFASTSTRCQAGINLPQISTTALVSPPRHCANCTPLYHTKYHFDTSKIGRKHKIHHQQAQQDKTWRNAEKGRGKPGKVRNRSKMGSEKHHVVVVDEEPQTLTAKTLEALTQYITEGRANRIVVMVCPTSPFIACIPRGNTNIG